MKRTPQAEAAMKTLSVEELRKLPYVTNFPPPDRIISLRSFWDHRQKDWILFLEVAPGELGRIKGGETARGSYFAHVPFDAATDVELPIGTLVSQYVSFPDVTEVSFSLENDANHLAAVMEKFRIISHLRSVPGIAASSLIATELEYLLFLCRSMYDLVQELARCLSTRVVKLDGSAARAIKNLPPSFRKVVLGDKEIRQSSDIQARFGLPPELADFYAAEARIFTHIRALRDSIAHGGKDLPHTYPIAKGFAVAFQEYPWSIFPIWDPATIIDGRFGSLHGLFAFLAHHVIGVTARFAAAFVSAVQLPPPIGPDVKVFLRSPFGRHLVALPSVIASPWEGDPDPTSLMV